MSADARALDLVGRFPPPLDGQAIATARLADLLAERGWAVGRHDVGAPEGDRLVLDAAGRAARAGHYLGLRQRLRAALAERPSAPVLWGSVSPSTPGHLRDRWLAPAFGGRPVVGVVHAGDFDRVFRGPTGPSARAHVRRLRALVFLSDALAARCADGVPADQRWTIPNTLGAVPPATTVAEARARRSERPGLRLLFLSNMIPSKGYADVLEALGLLLARGVEATARFVGRWPSRQAEAAFRARARALGLADRAHVLGGVGPEDVRAHLLDADVFALPTAYPTEAQPLTVIEALACGTPVVVTRWASLPEMVDDGVEGAFVPAGAPTAIADAAQALAAPERWAATSAAARARFDRQFSPAVVGAQWDRALGRL